MVNFDKALGVHPYALQVFSRRAKILASNLANADTPDYKARDVDFSKVLGSLNNDKSGFVQTSFSLSKGMSPDAVMGELLYRTPSQPSLDGNTVDVQTESAAFAENAIRFQATLQFLSGKFKGISKALRGE